MIEEVIHHIQKAAEDQNIDHECHLKVNRINHQTDIKPPTLVHIPKHAFPYHKIDLIIFQKIITFSAQKEKEIISTTLKQNILHTECIK